MSKDKKLIQNLNRLFKSKKFMEDLMKDQPFFSSYIFDKMGIVLEYYITTRDENINYTYEEILEKYNQLNFEEKKENILENGFMTHAFNGYKKERIAKNGLDYMDKISEEECNEIISNRQLLNELEDILGISNFAKKQTESQKNNYSNTVYISTPGAKTFHYACKRSPERLYEGPLKGYELEPIIVGESKSTYFFRILERKVLEKYKDVNNEEYENAMKIAEKVVNYYCSSSPAFAMINISEIKDCKTSLYEYEESKAEPLKDKIERACNISVDPFFCRRSDDGLETNNMGDLAILAQNIPQNAISIVECMDEFEMNQIIARMNGLKTGELIYNSLNKDNKNNPTLEQLTRVIKDCQTQNELDELNNTYKNTKQNIIKTIEEKEKILNKKYKDADAVDIKSRLEERKKDLLEKKNRILESSYVKKDGINTEYGLKEALVDLEQKGLMTELLKSDKSIKDDKLQYNSMLHGTSHTRRVNFFATLIMSSENVDKDTVNLIKEIVKNHDIGRENDIEDKEHGAKSVQVLEKNEERLSGLTKEQQDKLKFVITEHSLSARQNEYDLEHFFEEQKQKEIEIRIEKISGYDVSREKAIENIKVRVTKKYDLQKQNLKKILDICKDSDKLDRVRLDSRGIDLREGLDISRLSLDSSKKFENLAYESLDKILDILDIENELIHINEEKNHIDDYMFLKEETTKFERFETNMEMARNENKEKTNNFLTQIISGKRLSKILEVPKKIKELFKEKNKTKEVSDTEERI